jgi:sulfite reductase beta subunit-like hemoprotein
MPPEVKLNKIEQIKQDKDGLDILADLIRYSEQGDFSAIAPEDLTRFRWFGVYQQKPNADGFFMQRIKVPGGQLNPEQLRAIGTLADRFGRGIGDITTRQDIQLHWIRIEHVKTMLEILRDAGLTTVFACGDTPRNVIGCPLAGVAEDEIIDTSALAKGISDLYIGGGKEFSNLPRKFKPSIGGCPLHCHQPQINDFGFYAVRRPPANGRGAEVGFGLLVGGGLSDSPHFAQPMRVFVRPEQVLEVARAIAHLFRDQGYREKRGRARLKFLVADKGWEWTRQEIERNLGYALERDESLLQPPAVHSDHIGVGKQKDGRAYIGVPIERGRLTARNMLDLAGLSQRFADGPRRIRLSTKQNVLLLDIPLGNVADLTRALDDAGLPPHAHPLRATLISCTGTEFCNLAVVETKHRAGRVLRYLEETTPLDRPLMISFTGCPNACAQFQICDIGLTGIPVMDPVLKDEKGKPKKVDGYNVLLGGGIGSDPRFGEVIAKKIPADRIHMSLRSLIERYLAERQGADESFRAWVGRSAPESLQKLIMDAAFAPDAQPLPA